MNWSRFTVMASHFLMLILLVLVLLPYLSGCKNKVDEAYELKNLELKDKAIESLNKVISDDPKNASAYFALGNIYAELGRKDEAMLNFENALKLEPENARFKAHQLYVATEFGRNASRLEGAIEQQIQKKPNDTFMFALLSQALVSRVHQDPSSSKKYFENLLKLVELKPLSGFQVVCRDQASLATTLEDSIPIYDLTGSMAKQLKNGDLIPIQQIRNDTIYYTDMNSFVLETRSGWSATNAYLPGQMRRIDPPDPSTVYEQPMCAYTELDREAWFNSTDKYSYRTSPTIPTSIVEPGSITQTNLKKHYSASFLDKSDGRLCPIEYDWISVEYKARVFGKRKLPVSDKLLLFNGTSSYDFFKSALPVFANTALKNLFRAGYVANNMTSDMLSLSIYVSPTKVEFNRDNLTIHYQDQGCGKEFVFVDGFLTEIKNLEGSKPSSTK